MCQIQEHLKANDMEEPFQSAYKSQHSTETALLKVSSDVLNEIDNKKVCVLFAIKVTMNERI